MEPTCVVRRAATHEPDTQAPTLFLGQQSNNVCTTNSNFKIELPTNFTYKQMIGKELASVYLDSIPRSEL